MSPPMRLAAEYEGLGQSSQGAQAPRQQAFNLGDGDGFKRFVPIWRFPSTLGFLLPQCIGVKLSRGGGTQPQL